MSRRRALVALALAAAVLLLARRVTEVDGRVRNHEIFTEMAYSVAGESFAAAPALPDGRVQQPLVAGVVLRGAVPFFYGSSPEEAVRAGEELVNPFAPAAAPVSESAPAVEPVPSAAGSSPGAAPSEAAASPEAGTPPEAPAAGAAELPGGEAATPAVPPPDPAAAAAAADAATLERGGALYRIYCEVCHDARGDGRGTVVERGMLPPPSLHGANALAMKDGQIYHLLTYGRGNMSSYAAQLAPDERWLVIRFVRRLQQEQGS